LRNLGLAFRRGRVASLAGPFATLALVITVGVLASPLQHRVVEALPPWTTPAIRGGWASESRGPQEEVTGTLSPASGGNAFVVAVAQSGSLRLQVDDRRRARRLLRLHCDGCEVWTQQDLSLSPTAAVVDGEVEFAYWLGSAGHGTVQVELLTAWGRPLAAANIELRAR
jgi:hypothetical protein